MAKKNLGRMPKPSAGVRSTLSDRQNVGITYTNLDKVPNSKEEQDDQITPETKSPNQIADCHITTRATDTPNTTSAAVFTGKASQTVALTDREI